jgi:hypothetical protein
MSALVSISCAAVLDHSQKYIVTVNSKSCFAPFTTAILLSAIRIVHWLQVFTTIWQVASS